MEHSLIEVIFIFLLISHVLTNVRSEWHIKPGNFMNQPKDFDGFNKEFNGFKLEFYNPVASSSQQQNRAVLSNPFATQFTYRPNVYPNLYNNQYTQRSQPIRVAPQHPTFLPKQPISDGWRPYAPNYLQQQRPSQRYLVPNANNRRPNPYVKNPVVPNNYKYGAPQTGNSYTFRPSQPLPVHNRPSNFQPYADHRAYVARYRNDPILNRIRNDVDDNEKRLKAKEVIDNNKHSVNENENESLPKIYEPQEQENFEPKYEKYSPQKQPNYYEKPQNQQVDYNRINNKIKYPRPNVENVKIHPEAYEPLKDRIKNLREKQGQTFGGQKNEYPEEKYNEDEENEKESEGHDIFDRQKYLFDHHDNNFENDLRQHTPIHNSNVNALSPREEQEESDSNDDEENEDFIPVKMYAQVRHTETTRHLPQEAAYEEAQTYDEVLNAPRLREAIKTSKAQTVYSEEGYEDNAYDHAGHLKHASNHEGHGGYVKDTHEGSGKNGGSNKDSYESGGKSKHGHDLSTGKKWSLDEGKDEDYNNKEIYSKKQGKHGSKFEDLTEAGSEKKSEKKNISVPILKERGNIRRFVVTASVEKQVEDIMKMSEDPNESIFKGVAQQKKSTKLRRRPTYISNEYKRNAYVGSDEIRNKEINPTKEINFDGTEAIAKTKKLPPTHKNIQMTLNPDVEVFKSDLKLNKGPKHGGNYQSHPTLTKYPKDPQLFEKNPSIEKTSNKNEQFINNFNTNIDREQEKNNYDNIETLEYSNLKPNFKPERLVVLQPEEEQVAEIFVPSNNTEINTDKLEPKTQFNKKFVDVVEIFSPSSNTTNKFERLIKLPGRGENKYTRKETQNVDLSNNNQGSPKTIQNNHYRPKIGQTIQKLVKDDQFPITSQVELFRSDFETDRGPKHGGNYKKNITNEKRKPKNSELDDLNGFENASVEHLHGGNYRAENFDESVETDEQ